VTADATADLLAKRGKLKMREMSKLDTYAEALGISTQDAAARYTAQKRQSLSGTTARVVAFIEASQGKVSSLDDAARAVGWRGDMLLRDFGFAYKEARRVLQK
jgi:hypothetical protein